MKKRTDPSQFLAIGFVVFNVVIMDFNRVAQSEGGGNVVLRVYIVLGSFAWIKVQTLMISYYWHCGLQRCHRGL